MDAIAVWGFRWAPSFAQGLVRDLRVRWALHEAGLPYEARLIGVEERTLPAHRQRHPFGMVPVFEADGRQLIESGAIVYAIAKQSAALMPEDEPGRDQTLAWMFAALNTVDVPVQNLFDVDVLHPAETWAQLRRPDAVKAVEAHHLSVAAALQSCGKGCSVWSRLAMRRRPRVNQDVMLRRTRLGCWSGRLRSAGVAWWRASHWPVETAR